MSTHHRGFTLVELLVVLSILSLLSSIVVAAANVARKYGKIAHAEQELRQIQHAINLLAYDTGEWPAHKKVNTIETTGSNELWDLSPTSLGLTGTDGNYPGWSGPYISSLPLDPWGNRYFLDTDYSIDSLNRPCNSGGGCVNAVAIGSFGPDGVGQNVYNSDDIIIILAQ
jgi:prepilin-type N-terminal cleavage/methylation domain-containing protein